MNKRKLTILTATLVMVSTISVFATEKAKVLDGTCDIHGTKAVILTKTGTRAHAPYNEKGESNGNWQNYVNNGSIRAEFCNVKESGYSAGPGSDENYYCGKKYETNDWKNHWAVNEIQAAMNKGWINSSDIFRPNDSITRAEFIKITNKAFGFTSAVATESFTDVKENDWFYSEVRIALKAGYITSKNSTFRPNDSITREEVASIITSIKNNKDGKFDKLSNYKDASQVSEWAKSSVEGAIEQGYMGKGNDMFRPKDNITRAEAVVTLSRIDN